MSGCGVIRAVGSRCHLLHAAHPRLCGGANGILVSSQAVIHAEGDMLSVTKSFHLAQTAQDCLCAAKIRAGLYLKPPDRPTLDQRGRTSRMFKDRPLNRRPLSLLAFPMTKPPDHSRKVRMGILDMVNLHGLEYPIIVAADLAWRRTSSIWKPTQTLRPRFQSHFRPLL